jgi:surface protein
MDISNVAVTGEEIECPYTSFSDDDGNYEIEIEEESGATSKNAKVGVMAFKTVIFDRRESTLFQTVANDTDTSIVEPDAVLIALEYDATGLTASLGSTSALGNGLYSPVTDDVFFSAIEDCLDTNPVDGLCTDSEFGPMPDWDVSQVTNMKKAFLGRTTFNANISQWDTSSVTRMQSMFKLNLMFDQDVSRWTGSAATSLQNGMFLSATAFQAKYECNNGRNLSKDW